MVCTLPVLIASLQWPDFPASSPKNWDYLHQFEKINNPHNYGEDIHPAKQQIETNLNQ